jgi:ABC-type phosphate transport system permease subunit
MEADIVMMIAFATAAVLIVNQLGRVLRAMMLHRTIRKGIEHNNALTPELFDKIEEQKGTAGGFGDDRIGLVLLAIGLATVGFGLIQGNAENIRNLTSIALFPLFVGAALFGRWFYRRRAGAEG